MSRFVLLLAAVAAAASFAFAQDIVLPEGKAKTLIQNTCSECHGLDQVVGATMSSDEWRRTVNSMVKKGATLSPAEIDTVVEYLSVYFAEDKVNVNTASVKELQTALQITAAQAEAVVQYRKANGSFKDLDGLKKVNSLDPAKIEAKKANIVF